MKTALVLEGGASRGMFSCGVMDALLDNDIMADYIIGTSAGIANGVSYVSRQKERSLRIGVNYYSDKRYMGMRHLLNPKKRSYYNIDFVFKDIPNIYDKFDYKAFAEFSGNVIACLTNIETGKPEYVEVPRYEQSWKTVVASCSLPIMFEPVEIDGKLYMDGGMTDSIPYQKAIDDGCEKVIVVLTRERDYIKGEESMQKLIRIMYKKYPKLIECIANRHNMYNNARKQLFELEKQGRVFLIMPDCTNGFGRVEKRPEKIKEIYNQGYDIAMRDMKKLKEYLAQ